MLFPRVGYNFCFLKVERVVAKAPKESVEMTYNWENGKSTYIDTIFAKT